MQCEVRGLLCGSMNVRCEAGGCAVQRPPGFVAECGGGLPYRLAASVTMSDRAVSRAPVPTTPDQPKSTQAVPESSVPSEPPMK